MRSEIEIPTAEAVTPHETSKGHNGIVCSVFINQCLLPVLTQNSLVNNSSTSVNIRILHLHEKTQWKNTNQFLNLSHADSLYANGTEKKFSTHWLNECALSCMRNRMAAKYFRYSHHLQSFVGYWSLQGFCVKGYGTTAQLGMRLFRNSAATSAFGRPTSFGLEKPKQFQMLYFSWFCLSNLYTLQYWINKLIFTLRQFI